MPKATCDLCGYQSHYLTPHLEEKHGILDGDPSYKGSVTSSELDAAYETSVKKRKRVAPDLTNGLVIKFSGIPLSVNLDVPEDACEAPPKIYRVPQYGKLADDVRRVAVRVADGLQPDGDHSPIWVWGPPGTGKDAVFAALSAKTRTPCLVLNVAPDVDINAWLATRAFTPSGTYWEEGSLLKALRDGYTTPSGRAVPYLIVLSDLDRATRSQMEPLRAILDSLGGRVQAADGMHRVLQGTTIVATANTSGGGDTTGRFTSNSVDSSILDRFTFAVEFHDMDPRDEEPLLCAKFPQLAARFPDLIPAAVKAIVAIRDAIEKEEIFIDFGHRSACNWLSACRAEARYTTTNNHARILKAGLQDLLSKCPNVDTRETLKRLVDPHLAGGAVDEGDTSHISPDPLTL